MPLWPFENTMHFYVKANLRMKWLSNRGSKQEMFQKHIRPPWCKIQVYLLCRSKTCRKQWIKIYKVDNTLCSKEWFDLDLWTCDLIINRDHLLIGRNPCIKFGIDQAKGSKDTAWTTQWAEKNGLTFEHVTWKSIGIIYSLKATPAPSLVIDQVKWSKDIEWTTLGLQTNRHTDRPIGAKQYIPFFKGGGGHKNISHKSVNLLKLNMIID